MLFTDSMKQPHIYTLPERFLKDPAVPLRWKLYTILNGFWISGKPVFASNAWFAEKLGCSDRHVRDCLLELEKMYLITRHGASQKRRIIPGGHGGGTESSYQGGTPSVARAEPRVPHIADSIADRLNGASEDGLRVEEVVEEEENPRPKSKPKYPNAKTVFSWFPSQEKSWALNTTELKHAELLFLRTEAEVKKRLRYLREHEGEDFLPSITKPSDLERKWNDLTTYAKRNS